MRSSMSFKVELTKRVLSKITSWKLPDTELVEVFLRLRERIKDRPSHYLSRTVEPFDGMAFQFSTVDVGNRLCEHIFTFHVIYGQDEQSLFVVDGNYIRRFV